MVAKLKPYFPWIVCLALVAGGAIYDHAPAIALPDLSGWSLDFLSASKSPAAWVIIVRDEGKVGEAIPREQALAWDDATARKTMADAHVQFRLLDPTQRDIKTKDGTRAIPEAFLPWLDRAALVKSEAVILMCDATGKITDAAAAPRTAEEFRTALKTKGRLP